MRVVSDNGEIFTAGIACLPDGTDDDGNPIFEDIVYPSGRSLEFLKAIFGPDIYVVRDPA